VKEETRYIFSTGDLSRKDFSICFRGERGNVHLPIKDIKELYCFNDITLSTKLFEILSQTGIVIHFFGYYENYVGTFYPKNYLLSGRLTVAQALAYDNLEKRMIIGRAIVEAIANNIYFVLYHYYRHGKTEIKEYLNWLRKDVPLLLPKMLDIKHLMSLEGEIWAKFYATFSVILPEDFAMNKRVKRPPDNPINALVSFGNMLLYTKTLTQLYHTHLNQTISYLHEPMERRFSLSLDLAEAFKPLVVYKTIFDCVNNRKITVEKHFDKKLNYALLNDAGRKIFISEFEERINGVFEHAKLKRKVSYKQAIRLDAYKLIKFLIEEKPFSFFNPEDKK
jgi:CRISPR-associated protein Cas1